MPAYFFDSSALVKRFAHEKGTGFVLDLLRPSSKNRLYCARITEIEVCSALVRRHNAGTLTTDQTVKSMKRLRYDLPRRFTQIALTEEVLTKASSLAEIYALRAYDAVQLAAAIKANDERLANGLPTLIIVSAVKDLNDAAVRTHHRREPK